MKYIIVVMFVPFLNSCGYVERLVATTTGYSEICIEGVKYIQFTSGATEKINAFTLKPQNCDPTTGKDTGLGF